MKRPRNIADALLALGALACVVGGVAWFSPPWAIVVFGAILLLDLALEKLEKRR